MRKLLTAVIAFVALALGITIVHATPTTEIAVTPHAVAPQAVVGGQPDVLSLDVTITAPRGDVLDALVVRQEGTAQWERDLTEVVLWADVGAVGFQGDGSDRRLATGVWDAATNGWAFDRVFESVTAAGTRLFVTVTTSDLPVDQTTVRLSIPTHLDAGLPMSYDRGDRGIFLRTARVASLASVIGTAVHTVRRTTADELPPIVRITEPVSDATLNRNWLLIRGTARDAGGSSVSRVRIGVNRVGRATTWVEATPEVAGYRTWEVRLFDLPRPQAYELRVQAEDWVGNRSAVSAPVMIALTE